MTWAWDKDRNHTYDLPKPGQVLYPIHKWPCSSEALVAQGTECLPCDQEVMGLIHVRDSDFFFSFVSYCCSNTQCVTSPKKIFQYFFHIHVALFMFCRLFWPLNIMDKSPTYNNSKEIHWALLSYNYYKSKLNFKLRSLHALYVSLQINKFMRQESRKPINILITIFLDCKSSLRCLKASTPDKLPSSRETTYQSQMKKQIRTLFWFYQSDWLKKLSHLDDFLNVLCVHVQWDRKITVLQRIIL